MTVQEIMERAGVSDVTLAVAWIKDAYNMIQSDTEETLKVTYSNITDASDGDDNQYDLPADLISLKSISVKDTQDDKYKRIKRLVFDPIVSEDVSPS
jgi:hypothetical protein